MEKAEERGEEGEGEKAVRGQRREAEVERGTVRGRGRGGGGVCWLGDCRCERSDEEWGKAEERRGSGSG